LVELCGAEAIEFDKRVRHAVINNLPHEGDICHAETADAIVDRVGMSSCDLVTADGGNEPNDLDLAEQESMRLVIAQISIALRLQKKCGYMIVKIFEGSTDATRDLFQVLVRIYDEVHLVKPKTSRCGNSERYIVCCGYMGNETKQCVFERKRMSAVAEELHRGKWLDRLCTTRDERVDHAFEALSHQQCKGLESIIRAFKNRNEAEILRQQNEDAVWLAERLKLRFRSDI
jgi:hypothetical protein